MYICVCNGLNECAVRDACDRGARTAETVYRHHGVRPQCGKCVHMIDQIIRESHGEGLHKDSTEIRT
ncbi:MAG: (2Fe-2S)-binding protein [Rhodobacterales bacterium]|nr:(2Fe-2S)-binding protein [Rhodobacterales bacterium]